MATKLLMNRLCCDKTTEEGADEVYIIIAGKNSNGETFSVRFPGEGKHIDMNDGNQPSDNPNGDSHCITNRILCSVDILPGQSWDIIVLIMEEDGGTTKTAQEIGAAILDNTGNPAAIVVGEVLGILTELGVYREDTDDYIGSFAMHASNDSDGQVRNSYRPIDRARVTLMAPEATRQVQFRFDGDGSDYVGDFQFTL